MYYSRLYEFKLKNLYENLYNVARELMANIQDAGQDKDDEGNLFGDIEEFENAIKSIEKYTTKEIRNEISVN